MDTLPITGYDLYNAFVEGFKAVRSHRSHLNKINVFPVPDGDTGSNLVSTLGTIINETRATHSFKETIDSMANAALNGARGNSGIIFAQFINGINHEIRSVDAITTETLVESIRKAVPYAYDAILNPVEGTMITVIRDWSDAMVHIKSTVISWEEFILHSMEAARKSLANTPNLLEVLRKSSVVDSGAWGFVVFLEGVVFFIRNRGHCESDFKAEDPETALDEEPPHPMDNIRYRYCTEALISNMKVDLSLLKSALSPLGDSLITAGTASKCRVHIHTNQPAELFSLLRNYGDILQQKVDDMRLQYLIANQRRHTIALVTDSIADLPGELVDMHQIHVLPLNLLIDNSPYLDKLTITPKDFYGLIDRVDEYPTSTLPSQKSVEALFAQLTGHYDAVIAITVSGAMSGTFQCVERAARKFADQGKQIRVIDSRLNSGAQGLLVLEAARLLDEELDFNQVIAQVEQKIENTRIYVSIKTLKYMVRGGRISPLKGLFGKLLNLKPIISINSKGEGIAFGKSFTLRGNTNEILRIVKKSNHERAIRSFCVVHANAESRAQAVAERITRELGMEPEYITEISTVVGLNAGVGAVAVSFMQE